MPHTDMSDQHVRWQSILEYIDAYWSRLVRHNPSDSGTLIGLPNPYLVPSDGAMFQEMYYWDSYFMALGLRGTKLESMIPGMAENLRELMKRFSVIPNGSRFYFTSRSQPPFFTALIWEAYRVKQERSDADLHAWLSEMLLAAELEHQTVWMGAAQPHDRLHQSGLSRYFDINYLDILASCESGWDHSTRCDERWLEHLPVDLNSILYACELDMMRMAQTLGDPHRAAAWQAKAEARAEIVRTMLWDDSSGFFLDYDFKLQQLNPLASLAGFYPLWAGIATPQQAERMVTEGLPKFLHSGGLVTTLTAQAGRQWAFPNGWAPLHWLVDAGLERYGYASEARVLRVAWLETIANEFERTGALWEKYNVTAARDHAVEEGVYGQVSGFGWTNAVFKDFAGRTIYTDSG